MTYSKFFSCENLDVFNTNLEAGIVDDLSLVFISSTKQIWTHGTFYNCPYSAEEITKLVSDSEDNLTEMINSLKAVATTGKDGLMSASDKTKLDSLEKITVDSALSSTSTNPVENKAINTALAGKSDSDHTHNYAGSSSAGGAANSVKSSMTLKVNGGDTEGTSKYTFNGSTDKTLDIKAGDNVTLSTTSGSLTINAKDTTYEEATQSSAGLMSAADKVRLEGLVSTGGEPNQNAFANVKVGTTVIESDNISDTLELAAGDNVTLTPDATSDKVTISSKNTTYTAGDGLSLIGTEFSHADTSTLSGSYGPTANVTGSEGETIVVPQITVDEYGHVTGVTNRTYTSKDTTYSNATTSANGLMSSTDKTKLDGIETGAQVNTVTGVKGSSESTYRTGNIEITKANIGLGNVTNESKATMFTNAALTGTPTAPTATSGTNTTQIATTAFVQSAIDSKIAAADAMIYKGTVDAADDLPSTTAKTGWTYKVATAGTYAGEECEVGDMIICLTDGSNTTAATWSVVQTNVDGAVTGPSSSTNAHVAVFNGATGKVIKDSGYTIAKSVPSNAVFTDTNTKVTSVGNHYTPAENTSSAISAADGTATNVTGTSGKLNVVTGLKRDAAGHVVGVTSANIYSTDNNTTYTAGNGLTLSGTTLAVGAGTGISVSADSISVKYGTAAGTAAQGDDSRLSDARNPKTTTLSSNNLNDVTTPGFYEGGGSNTVTNKPSGVDAFGLHVFKTANGYVTQQLTEGNTNVGCRWTRQYDGSSWTSWIPMPTFTATPTSGQVVVTDGTTGKIKSSGYTIAKSVPSNAVFTDTHYTTGIVAGASGATANASATNPYVAVKDNSTYRSQIRLVGSGATTVTSDASGNITISSTDNNTTYSNMTAATSSAAGTSGLVPAPAAGKQASFLRGDGTWVVPTNTTYSAEKGITLTSGKFGHSNVAITAGTAGTSSATSGSTLAVPYVTYDAYGHITAAGTHTHTISGFLTSHQTIKQDGVTGATANRYAACSTAAATAAKTASVTAGTFNLEAGARVTVKFANANTASTPTLNINSKGAKNIFHKGSQITTGSNKSLLAGAVDFIYDGTQWHLVGNYIDTNTTYPAATTSAAGLMSAADKVKLDGCAASADAVTFTRSLSSGTKIGTININGTGTDLYCQTNTNTTYSAGNGLTLSSTTFNVGAGTGISVAADTVAVSSEVYRESAATTAATAGWYRIATSIVNIVNCTGIFQIMGAVSGRHTVAIISAGTSYGVAASSNITVLQCSHYSSNALTKVRIVYHTAYSGKYAYVEVYNPSAVALPIYVKLLGGYGWSLVTPSTAGSIPSGYSNKEATLSNATIYSEKFSGNGSELSSLNASNISSGTIAAARLPAATTSAQGAMTAAMVTKLNGIATGANAYSLPNATSSVLGGVKVGSNITVSSGTISLTKANVTSALGYTPPTTNTTYSNATTSAAGLMSATDKSKLDGITASADTVSFSRSLTSGTKIGTITINGTGTDLYCQTNTNTTYSAGTGLSLSSTTFSLSASGVTAGSAGPTAAVTGNNNSTIAVPRITVDTYGRVTALTSYNLTCKNTTYSVATASANGLMAAADKSLSNFLQNYTTATTLASLNISYSTIYATLSKATSISLSGTLAVGRSITVICNPTASFTQPIPTSGSYVSMDGDSLSITSGKVFEINIYAYTSGKYSISCKTAK